MKSINEIIKETGIKIKNIPLDIKSFFVFAVIITLTNWFLWLDSNKALRELTIPYTGWNVISGFDYFVFFIPLSYLVIPINANTNRINIIVRVSIMLMMLMRLSFGIEDWLSISPEDYTSTNPYLRYDALTPIYTMVLPLFWILVMVGALLNSFLKKRSQNRSIQTT